jgi:hypothetical protein
MSRPLRPPLSFGGLKVPQEALRALAQRSRVSPVECPLKRGLSCRCTPRLRSESRCFFCRLNGVEEFGLSNSELCSELSDSWTVSTVRTFQGKLRTVSEQLGVN